MCVPFIGLGNQTLHTLLAVFSEVRRRAVASSWRTKFKYKVFGAANMPYNWPHQIHFQTTSDGGKALFESQETDQVKRGAIEKSDGANAALPGHPLRAAS